MVGMAEKIISQAPKLMSFAQTSALQRHCGLWDSKAPPRAEEAHLKILQGF